MAVNSREKVLLPNTSGHLYKKMVVENIKFNNNANTFKYILNRKQRR